jgi:hypothetical protein
MLVSFGLIPRARSVTIRLQRHKQRWATWRPRPQALLLPQPGQHRGPRVGHVSLHVVRGRPSSTQPFLQQSTHKRGNAAPGLVERPRGDLAL